MVGPVRYLRQLVLFAALYVLPDIALAQGHDAVWARHLVADAFFHLEVTGTRASKIGKPALVNGTPTFVGKAFAITPKLLLAPQHIVGYPGDWAGKVSDPARPQLEEVTDALRPLDRKIGLTRLKSLEPADGLSNQIRDAFVVSPVAEELDVVALSLNKDTVSSPLHLSLCNIVDGNIYTAILTHDTPQSAASMAELVAVPLVASGRNPELYGNLYVFQVKDSSGFKVTNGHEGSPILDDQDAVVAVVSAVITDDAGNTTVLATPIGPSFPGAIDILSRAPDGALQNDSGVGCSLSQTVRRMNDRVATQAFWSVDAKRDKQGEIGKVVISYESTAEHPNVSAIKLNLEFWGKENGHQDTITRITDSREQKDQDFVVEGSDDAREFDTDEVSRVARELIKPRIKDHGYISFVKVYIFPRLNDLVSPELRDGSGFLINPIVRKIYWTQETKE
ncbi:hypothetical protein MPL3365_30311 [Mesorhizobium plurifarium]|uniref:Uncharacterized protein n=1 Tax=Mesorhizobium plurifarium TaxID=69974 RepID=A0A090GED3_MESPL|nr:hypothetical protein MPL3365_30311 [Mesorhizobium plurifarium]